MPAGGLRTRVDATVAAVAGITALGFVFRVVVLVRPIGVVDKLFISDDAYYTLTIARSIAHGHGPTVDGHTLTSGFQALLGFLMVPVSPSDRADGLLPVTEHMFRHAACVADVPIGARWPSAWTPV